MRHDPIWRTLETDEGRVPHAYQDHLGYWTIGVGHLVDKRMDEIVKTVAAIQIEQASAKVLAPTNTNTENL